jgi:hypothetical protein
MGVQLVAYLAVLGGLIAASRLLGAPPKQAHAAS